MKKFFLSALALAAVMGASAINIGEITPVQLADGIAFHPVLSPDGTTLLYSTVDHTGLKALDLKSGNVTIVDEAAAAGFSPIFSTDGKTVLYRTADMVDGLIYRDVRSFDLNGAKRNNIAPLSRQDVNLQHVAGNADYALATYRTITVAQNGKTTEISPLEDANSYLWASLSPDGTKLMFTEPFSGVYISNLDGSDAHRIARKGDSASWVDNNTIIYVVSKDDGYVTMSSQLMAMDIATGETTAITPDNVLVGEASAAAGKVVFNNVDGKLFTVTLK